jgi:hypothetical protein
MKELSMTEIDVVSGGEATLQRPIDKPESELGKQINDIAGAINSFGSFLGGKVYDWTHPVATR